MFRARPSLWRKPLFVFCLSSGVAAIIATAADSPTDPVFVKVRAGIVTNVADLRGVSCLASVERTRYLPRKPAANGSCGDIAAAMTNTPRGVLEWRSRLRLNVAAGESGETFALTDAGPLEKDDIGGMLSAAAAGSGEFHTFLRNLISGEGDPFQSRGVQQTGIGRMLAFGFQVPAEKSHFGYANGTDKSSTAAYGGSLFTTESGELKELVIQAENAGPACRVQYVTDYASTRIGDHEVLVPRSSMMDAVLKTGAELHTETYYSGCRRVTSAPSAVPSITAPRPVPPNVRLRVRLQPPIDVHTAAAGEPVVAVIRGTVKDKVNGMIVHAGDRLHGRIASIEEYLVPQHRWDIAIAFETIERGVGDHGIDQGVEQPVVIVPADERDRINGKTGYMIFHDPELLKDRDLETDWETR
jgi:hypothetical protein